MAGVARAYVSPVTVTGLALSVGLSLTLDLTGAATGVESLLAGLMGATLTLVLESSARAERRFRLRSLLETTDWLPGPIVSVATATRQFTRQHPAPEIVAEARRRLQSLSEDFDELARGRIVRPGTDYELLLAGTDACHRRLQAITNIPDGPAGLRWWDSEIGQRYWDANLDALSRGVAITRVFVCARMDADLAALISTQSQAGVTTLVAMRDMVDSALHVNLVVWEGRRAWEARMNAHGDIVGNVFTVNERDVQRLADAFTTCAQAARAAGV
jgi:hypothetical protein